MFPEAGQAFDWVLDSQSVTWVDWMASAPPYTCKAGQAFSSIMVPTADTVCYTHLMQRLLLHGQHVLAVGETGTGKTFTIQVRCNAHGRRVD